jgi:hypothetical protein
MASGTNVCEQETFLFANISTIFFLKRGCDDVWFPIPNIVTPSTFIH